MFLSPRPNYYGTRELIPLDDELLPEKFKDYLKQPENDCYRSADGIRVQIDALITFTNQFLALSCVCAVVPRSAIPNCRAGIILCRTEHGHKQTGVQSVPRAVLSARGESVPEIVWVSGGIS